MKTAEIIHLSGKNKNKSAVEQIAQIVYTIGLVLFVFIMMNNIVMEKIIKNGGKENA